MFAGSNATTSITLYNRVEGPSGTGRYERTVLKDVFWADVKQKNVLKSGLTSADSVYIQVNYESLKGYTPPKEYYSLADKTGRFTFNAQDLIVKGEISDIMTGNSNQALSTFMKQLKEYDNCVTISIVDVNLFGSPAVQHIQLGCK